MHINYLPDVYTNNIDIIIHPPRCAEMIQVKRINFINIPPPPRCRSKNVTPRMHIMRACLLISARGRSVDQEKPLGNRTAACVRSIIPLLSPMCNCMRRRRSVHYGTIILSTAHMGPAKNDQQASIMQHIKYTPM